ncbi:hypothetical protein FALBO_10727 [Fusarium albosuccineum]|uniref:Uncharacterized protein n=1 Tax=Fusarium albosuccineum TaxID=1237068 RepID=A0A8H4PIA6_9HYPO|nr:hypothetical protein FALBO_10727 [Fusarium albosuccineum]
MAALGNLLGFPGGRTPVPFLVFAGFLFVFSTLQLPFIDVDNVFCGKDPWASPGECYWFGRPGITRTGIRLHLATMLPAGAMVCLQFVPALRQPRFAKYHRMNGYLVLALSAIGTIGALMVEKRAFGGPFSARIGTYIMAVSFATAMVMGMISIKKRQFDRTAIVVGSRGSVSQNLSCDLIQHLDDTNLSEVKRLPPDCSSYLTGEDPGKEVLYKANWDPSDLPGLAVALRTGYLVGGWTAFTIHAVGIEAYLRMTAPRRKLKQ